MNAAEKAHILINNGQVFKVGETERYSYYTAKGLSNTVYEVVFDRLKQVVTCSCKNVRLTAECSHILAAKELENG